MSKPPTGLRYTESEKSLRRALQRQGLTPWQVYKVLLVVYRWVERTYPDRWPEKTYWSAEDIV